LVSVSGRVEASAGRSSKGHKQFVGRAHELGVVGEAFEDVVASRGRLVLVAGEPGIGKTRLCEQVADYARRHDAAVCWGRCYEGEGAPPFWPWVQVLRLCIKELDVDTLTQALGADAVPLAQLVPELSRTPLASPQGAVTDSPESRFQLFDAVARLLQLVTVRAPLVLLFDDIQGADASSLLLLHFVVRALRESRLLTVATYRDLPLPGAHPLSQTLGELARVPGRQQMRLAGFSTAEVAEYLHGITGVAPSNAAVAALHQRTEGNPLFLSEFIDAVRAEHGRNLEALVGVSSLTIPPTVRAVIERRLAPLSEVCREVLQVAAVVGRDIPGELLRAFHPAAVAALQEAIAVGIVSPDVGESSRYRFAHALIRETLYSGLAEAQRHLLHRQVAEALEQQPDASERVAELAHHFDAAGDSSEGGRLRAAGR
jgi:predicted ATPase